MAFQLKQEESVRKGVKRLSRKEIDKALKLVTGRKKIKPDEAVHETRKRLKKVRALLRLIRDGLGSKVYRQENCRFRDAVRPLTEVRDAKILVGALDQLTEHFAKEVSVHVFKGPRQSLLAHLRAVRKRVLQEQDAFASLEVTLGKARQRVKDWTIGQGGWSVLGRGLKRVYQSAYQAYFTALDDPTVENLHEWRKQVKYLWHQLQVLQPIWPEVMEELAEQAHELSGYLGDDHDLVLLRERVAGDAAQMGDQAAVETLLAVIDRRRAELQEQATSLGQRFFQDKPRDFVARLRGYWQVWRSEVPAAAPAS
jgi:CHAD domain-containing protein